MLFWTLKKNPLDLKEIQFRLIFSEILSLDDPLSFVSNLKSYLISYKELYFL